MRELPVLMSGPMVRATLQDIRPKTQTRRLFAGDFDGDFDNDGWPLVCWPSTGCLARATPRYGVPGDRLWVRETWAYVGPGSGSDLPDYIEERKNPAHHHTRNCWYAADDKHSTRWTPSIYMPRWASRILLEVVAVRAERLQDISEADAAAEGVTPNWAGPLDGWDAEQHGFLGILDDPNEDDSDSYHRTAREAYQQLWDSLNAKRGHPWTSDPWVWVIEFRRLVPPLPAAVAAQLARPGNTPVLP